MGRIQIKGSEHPIGKVFSNDYVFTIPLYQRPYAWQCEQAEELLDDLLTFLGNDADAVSDLNPYFLGSIVIIKEDHKPDAEVVDGQQRLTTLAILLSAIRSLLRGEDAKGLTQYIYERGNSIEETSDRFRLALRERDATFFKDYVQKEGQIDKLAGLDSGTLSDSQRNIQQNAMLLLARLGDMPEERRKRLAQFIVKQCLLVVVSTPDFDSAYRIFSVLNTRGLDLLHSDILKSEIIGKVPSSDQERYGKKWEDAEEGLGRDAFADLFSHVRTIYRKLKLKGTILSEFREYVVKKVPDPKKLIDDVLIPMADAYSDIRLANYEAASSADEINRLLKWLNRIDNVDWLPPAILYLAKHRHDPSAVRKFLIDLERLAAILMIRRTTINQRIERYGNLITAIETNQDLYTASSPLQLTAKECGEAVTRLDGDIYGQLPKVRTYILLRLDSALSGGGATYDHDLITVEHVLPQSPAAGSQWEKWFPDVPMRYGVVHRLGNLVLLTRRKNSSAGNYEFDKKKASYFSKGGVSPFVITTQVLAEKVWTPAVVDKRQADLLAKMKSLWRL
jgi:uncharacterized protein with ParB-like and HNH nuclease domain